MKTGKPLYSALKMFCTICAGLLLCVSGAVQADTLVVLNKAEASASLIDLDSGEEVARLETGEGPHEAAVSPDGRTAVVTDYGAGPNPGNTLTVIDIASASVTKTIDLGEYSRPHGIEYFADGERVAVTAEAQKALIVVDVASGEITRTIETGQEVSHMVALSPDGTRAYVANIGSGTMTVLDLEQDAHVADVATGAGAEGICVTPDGQQVWVTNREDDTVSVVDAETLTVIENLPSASFPIRAKATPDGQYVLVTNPRSDELAVFDASKLEEHKRIKLDIEAADTEGRLFGDAFGESSVPIGVLIAPDGRRAFIAHANADVVSIIDLQSWEITGLLRGGKEPDGLGYSTVSVEK